MSPDRGIKPFFLLAHSEVLKAIAAERSQRRIPRLLNARAKIAFIRNNNPTMLTLY
jgi:hypothetical protein